jgi:hypothetical protein
MSVVSSTMSTENRVEPFIGGPFPKNWPDIHLLKLLNSEGYWPKFSLPLEIDGETNSRVAPADQGGGSEHEPPSYIAMWAVALRSWCNYFTHAYSRLSPVSGRRLKLSSVRPASPLPHQVLSQTAASSPKEILERPAKWFVRTGLWLDLKAH